MAEEEKQKTSEEKEDGNSKDEAETSKETD